MSRNGDVHILTGMEAIVNPDNIKPGIDLKELERQMVSGGLITQKIKDPQDRFNDELREAASKFGISFGELPKEKGPPAKAPSPIKRAPAFPTLDGGSTPRSQPKYETKNYSSDSDDGAADANNAYVDDDSNDDNNDKYNDNNANSESSEEDGSPETFARYDNGGSWGKSPQGNRFSSSDRPRYGSDLNSRTREQERREHIDSVMGSADGAGFSFEKEKREDMKCAMLAEIDSLLSTLADEDIDLTRIPKVDRTSDYEAIESVLKMLRHKNDHTRYCSFAEEFLLFGAYALEELFDGKRMWFGRYQPDLTGYHNQVNVKLRRMKHDTGQIVSGVMQDYNIGPGARVLLELVPGMVLYSKLKKQQHGQEGLFTDAEMQNAAQNIRNYTE